MKLSKGIEDVIENFGQYTAPPTAPSFVKKEEIRLMLHDQLLESADKKRGRKFEKAKKKELDREESIKCEQYAAVKRQRELRLSHKLAEEMSKRKHAELISIAKSKTQKRSLVTAKECQEEILQAIAIKRNLKREDKEKEASLMMVGGDSGDKTLLNDEEIFAILEKKNAYREALQNQMIDNHRRRREEMEETFRDGQMREETKLVLKEEDIEKEKKGILRAEEHAFAEARMVWLQKQKERCIEEHQKAAEVIAKKEADMRTQIAKKEEKRAMKQAIREKVSKNLVDERNKMKKERAVLGNELQMRKYVEQGERDREKLMLKQENIKKQSLIDAIRSQRIAAEKKAKDDAIEVAFARYLSDQHHKFTDDENRKAKEAREKRLQYGKELREMMLNLERKKKIEEVEALQPTPPLAGESSGAKICENRTKFQSKAECERRKKVPLII